jgi:hypothetical protein
MAWNRFKLSGYEMRMKDSTEFLGRRDCHKVLISF